ncbi:MAG: response regulator [Armatimonadetes bacterium]|nr:response regulator [Armatimonadota bacterium]
MKPMSPDTPKKKRALIVDDDYAVVQLVKLNLEIEGIEVEFAHDGLQGLDCVRKSAPDIVILDVNMPRLDGWDVLWELRNTGETRGIPVVMLTIESDGDSITKGWSGGVDCYLPKPFDPHELVSMVQRLLEISEEEKYVGTRGT